MRRATSTLLLALLAGARADAAARHIDGLAFPETLDIVDSSLAFVGGGTRFKYGMVKVYAVGLYSDVKLVPGEEFDRPPKELATDASFYQTLGAGTWSLFLQVCRRRRRR